MPTGSRKHRVGSTEPQQDSGTIQSIQDIFSLKPRQNATFPVHIVQEKNSVTIWIFYFLEKSWMKLVNTDLEALAYTFSENPSFTQGSLTLSPTSNGKIRATLFSSPQTEQRSMNVSMTLSEAVLVKHYGAGDLKPSLCRKLKRSLGNGESSESDSSKK